MASKLLCAFAAVWTSAASGLTSEMEEALAFAGLARFRAVHGIGDEPLVAFDEYSAITNKLLTASPDMNAATTQLMKDVSVDMNRWHKKFSSVPASDPMWSTLRKRIKANMMATSKDAREWIGSVERKDWESFNKKSCAFIGGSTLTPEPGKTTVRPTDAFYCGHPAVDWSGGIFGGKPINDLCHATVGDASKPSLCGKYSDKEIVLGLAVGIGDEIAEDARNVNVMTVDCLMDIVDGDIYYCQKCAGRCNG